jgi:hypothetical protein
MTTWNVKNASLVSRSNPLYLSYCREKAALKNSNPRDRVPDPRYVVTNWAEKTVNRYLGRFFEYDDRSILSWSELDSRNTYRRKYKELDGIFFSQTGSLYVETKGSFSKSSLKRGVLQVNENLKLLSIINPRFAGLLVLCDCHLIDPELGVMAEELKNETIASKEYLIYQGLSQLPKILPSTKSIWLLGEGAVLELVDIFGSPLDDPNTSES